MGDVNIAMEGTAWVDKEPLNPPLELAKKKKPFQPFVHRKPFVNAAAAAFRQHHKTAYPKDAKKGNIRPQIEVLKFMRLGCCKMIYRNYQAIAKEKIPSAKGVDDL